jgi:hypothetical protein
MASPNFGQVWEAAKILPPAEMERLRTLLETLLARRGQPLTTTDELDLLPLKNGLLKHIPPPIDNVAAYENWKPVAITGPALSETIIEERR